MFSSRSLANIFTGVAAFIMIAVFISSGTAQPKSSGAVSDGDLGIRKGSVASEEQVVPDRTEYSKAEAGSAKTIGRSFENSPALIPHDIEGMLPITIAHNQCIDCHMPDAAKQTGATPVPRSHLMKLAEGKDLHGKLDGERFNCVECHVRQSTATPPVKNTFTAGFRNRKEMSRSNLADTVNQGVRGE